MQLIQLHLKHQLLNSSGGSNFNWSVISGDPISLGNNFSCNGCSNPVINPAYSTVYKVVSNLSGGCSNTDTVYTCSGDSTAFSSISATGGIPFLDINGNEYYNFNWQDASGNSWNNYASSNGVTSTISGIPTGIYNVTVIDANGCNEYTRFLRVLESNTSLVIDSTKVLDVLCFDEETAEVKAYFSGGFGPYLTVLTHVNGANIDTIYQSINNIDSVTVDS